jgi:hypothetical protein
MKQLNEAYGRRAWAMLWSVLPLVFPVQLAAADALPPYHIDSSQTSVSGVSSGGYMAVQFHVAYSGIVRGVGVIAGGPYNCAENSASKATQNCMKPDASHPAPDVNQRELMSWFPPATLTRPLT